VDTGETEVTQAAVGDGGKGLALAYRYINRRERTVVEVRERLEKAEIPHSEIESVLAELIEFGYLDDARYARVFTQDKRGLEGWGNERIARSLGERGVDRDLVAGALAEGMGALAEGEPAGETGRAIAVLAHRFPAGPAEPRDRERAFGVLVRKGYESETAADAVREWARQAAV